MRVVYSDEALADLDATAVYVSLHYPAAGPAVRARIRAVIAHIARWPESARRARGRHAARPLSLQSLYRIFYRLRDGAVEILHIHHTARQPWVD